MYAGSTLTPLSGHILGAHQRIDRIARRYVGQLLPHTSFPSLRQILYFEGHNGPDAIKRKSPAKDEPWHFFQPFDTQDTQLIGLIEHHYELLVDALRREDMIRAAFEAAWLSHAVVDGLTPAHQYPYEEKLVELQCGRGIEDRTSIGKKLIMSGETAGGQVHNNWKMWGPKGLFTTHAAFEWGVAMLMMPHRYKRHVPRADKLADFQAVPIGVWFRSVAQDVARLELYDNFYETGWTVPLARRVRRQLAPMLLQAVATIWHGAMLEAAQPSRAEVRA